MWGAAKLAIWPHVLRAPPCPVDSGPSTLCASPLGPASLTQRKNYLDEQLNPSPQPGNGGSWTERRGEEEPLAWGRFPFLWKMTGGPSWRGYREEQQLESVHALLSLAQRMKFSFSPIPAYIPPQDFIFAQAKYHVTLS